MLLKKCLLLLLVFLIVLSCERSTKDKEEKTNSDLIAYEIVRTFPHDPYAFTEGLLVHEGKLFESTGREKTSWIAEVSLSTGRQDKKIVLGDNYFGEGMTIINNKIYQLTYTTQVGFVYDLKTYKKLKEFAYSFKEGWGMTTDGTNLVISDGTSKIHFLDTLSLKETKSISVKYQNNPLDQINELEWIDGFIYANQWQTNYILKIDPATGNVLGKMDFNSITKKVKESYPEADVLNGIAYEARTKTFLITGKLWPVIYAVKLK